MLMRRFCRCFSTIKDKIRRERDTRLGKTNMESILPTATQNVLQKIRNIGIIAHIDAGKTTTTQRMLYYAGALPSPGQIDEGTTTMDYMKQERQRGITIRSAAISFNWNHYQINLIDTPGHVDFSGQVTRSLRVLDGAVTIVDGVKGVEAQTIKVWEHATKRGIPKICFINKMDRIGASMERTIMSLERRLNLDPIILQAPIGQDEHFKGVVDLINMKEIYFEGKYGQDCKSNDVPKNHLHYNHYFDLRQALLQKIANYDEEVGELYLAEQPVPSLLLTRALRRILGNPVHYSKVCPILLGAAFRNKGVQPLLNAVIDYLPSPSERPPVKCMINQESLRKPLKTQKLTAYVFKMIYDAQKGPLAYTRIYSGELKKTTSLLNSSKNQLQRINQIFRVRANQYIPVAEVSAGDIVAISGLTDTIAGQTLTSSVDQRFLLQNLELPSPIFTMPFELDSKKDERAFMEAIKKAILQDNSLLYSYQEETGQYLISGLGELHLEILRDKLVQEGINVKIGNLKINYKETVNQENTNKLALKIPLKNDKFQEFQIELKIVPLRSEDNKIIDKTQVIFTFEKVQEFEQNWKEFVRRKELTMKKTRKQENLNEVQQPPQILRKLNKRSIRNPTPLEPIQEQDEIDEDNQVDGSQFVGNEIENEQDQSEDEDESENGDGQNQSDQALYHINTLPFQTLYELVEICKSGLLSGKRNFPMMGVQLQISYGTYRKSRFSKKIMNKCTSQALQQLLIAGSVLLQPMVEFNFEGQEAMIDIVIKQILRRRGNIANQQITSVNGLVPASSIKGWIKDLRAMGLQVSMKFANYEEIHGENPDKLIEENS